MSHAQAMLQGSWRGTRREYDAKADSEAIYRQTRESKAAEEPGMWPADLCGDVVILDGDGVTDALRGAISESGYTAYQIAKASGVAERTVSRFLGGDRLISSSFDKLCATFRLCLCVQADGDDDDDGG